MKIAFITLGCKVNQYETEAMRRLLESEGHTAVERAEDADAVVVNTCAVTGESARKSRQAIRRARRAAPAAKLVVCGCAAQADAESARSLGADYVSGAGERLHVVEYLNGIAAATFEPAKASLRREFEELPAGGYDGHARAYLKVQDGCNNYCSYCIIPYLRGRPRSLAPERAAELAAGLAADGYREIVLTGIEISSYGTDIGSSLGELVEAVAAAAPAVRLRLGSLEPSTITRSLAERLHAVGTLCPHFHLSLQSGSAGVLSRMRRKYTPDEFISVVDTLRDVFDDPAITTDIIMGFPQESDAEVEETLAFIERAELAAAHVFPYSIREGTRAAEMDGQIPKAEKERRAHLASAAAKVTRDRYLARQVGRTLELLSETEVSGHTENYCELRLEEGEAPRGELVRVKVTRAEDGVLYGVLA